MDSVEMAYDTFGRPGDTPVILIMGLGEKMIAWLKPFFEMLADNKFFAIRFDNTDTGLSTKFGELEIADVFQAWDAYFNADPIDAPDSFQDMADDVVGLLDRLGIEKAHICGFSLGSMIAQNMSFLFPERTCGMVCMGSSAGHRTLPPPRTEVLNAMALPPPDSRTGYIDHSVSISQTLSGGSPFYDAQCRAEIAAASYDRCYYPHGFLRQNVAMLADGCRTKRLSTIQRPTLVMHGVTDPLSRVGHGRAIARAVPESEIRIQPDWGHGLDFPKLWPPTIQIMTDFSFKYRS